VAVLGGTGVDMIGTTIAPTGIIEIEIETAGIATRIGIVTGIEMTAVTDRTQTATDSSRREWDRKQQSNS